MSAPRLVLASASPRRAELLREAGFEFVVEHSEVIERARDGESPLRTTTRLAAEKAVAVASRRCAGEIVLGADTSVVIGSRMLGKPVDAADAVAMLLSLSGHNHHVITAWMLVESGGEAQVWSGATISTVRMREIGRAEAEAYVATGEPMDKAGAYAAQGRGCSLIAAILGARDNVIGLPVVQVARALAALGLRAPERPGAGDSGSRPAASGPR